MKKRILLVTSAHTGAGHQSISDALAEQFAGMPGVEVKIVDGFDLIGRIGVRLSGLYGFMTRHAPAVFNAAWKRTMAHPPRFAVTSRLYSRCFMKCVRLFQPDLILTVHSLFNTMLTRILEKQGLNIPVVVLQADLVNIHSTWCNPAAFMTLCPTREAYDASIRQGMPPEKLKVLGFPVRGRFCDAARLAGVKDGNPAGPLRCLLMSGGECPGSLSGYARAILENTDAAVTVICGRNKKLYRELGKSLGSQYGGRVTVLGFVSDVEQAMLRSDLLIARGSPNTLMEAVTMNVPVVMIGPLLEQERSNPWFMQHYGLGVPCGSPAEVPEVIRGLLDDDAARLREIRAAQLAFRSFDSARNIAACAAELAGADGASPRQ